MIKEINIGNKNKAIEQFSVYKKKNYGELIFKLTNLHIRNLNKITGFETFKKNDAYISGKVLYKVLNDYDERNIMNFHGLNEELLYNVFRSLKDSTCFFKSKDNRFVILTSIIVGDGNPILVVLEIDSSFKNNPEIKINKIVTIYPKRNIISFLKSHNGKEFYTK